MKLIPTTLIMVSILSVNAQTNVKTRLLNTNAEQESLQLVVNNYNHRIAWWDKGASPIDLSRTTIIEATQGNRIIKNSNAENNFTVSSNKLKDTTAPTKAFNSSTLNEIVVTAMGIKKSAREIPYSTATLKGDDVNLAKGTNIATGMAGKVAGMQVNLSSNGVKANTRITLRGDRSISGNNQALLVVDDIQLPISFLGSINPNDVDNVTVLKGGAASALYGSDASNGVIIVTTKKGKGSSNGGEWRKYRLDNAEDVDYLVEIKNAAPREYVSVYEQQKRENAKSVGFYLDMADFFFQHSMQEKGLEILHNAVQVTDGSIGGLKDVAYTLESWKKFDEAINIYKKILEKNDDAEATKRDLALAYFRNGNYQLALNTYYAIITGKDGDIASNSNLKQIAMSEMNALIAIHSNNLDLTGINLRLVRALPVDLRISVESNNHSQANLLIQEPNTDICYAANADTRSGGQLSPSNNLDEDSYSEYSIKKAVTGKYRISIKAFDEFNNLMPHIMRIIVFKNFQKPGQTIEIKNVTLDNQYGEVEIGDTTW